MHQKLLATLSLLIFFHFSTFSQPWFIYDTGNSGIADNGVEQAAVDLNGDVWICHWGFGVSQWDGANWTVYNANNSGLADDFARAIAVDSAGNKWIGTTSGLCKFDGTNWTVYSSSTSAIPNDNVRSVGVVAGGLVWVGTSFGLASFDGASTWVTYNSINSLISGDVIRGIDFDGTDVWAGTENGVSHWNGTLFVNYTSATSALPAGVIFRRVHVDTNSDVWVGSQGGGLSYFDGANWTVYNSANSGLPSDVVNDAYYSSGNNLWAATDSGLAKFDGTNWTVYTATNSTLPVNQISSIAAQGGVKWVGTFGGGIVEMLAILGLEEAPDNFELEIFPVPAQAELNLVLDAGFVGHGLFRICDMQGRALMEEFIPDFTRATLTKDIRGLANGIYQVEIRNGGRHCLRKFSVQR